MNSKKQSLLGLSIAAILAISIFSVIGIQEAEADGNKLFKFFRHFIKKADFVAKMDTSQIPDVDRYPGGDTSQPPLFDDRGKTGMAKFFFDEDKSKLEYTIVVDGLDLKGYLTADDKDDVTKIHLHEKEPGLPGPHVFNLLGAPCEPDHDLSFFATTGTTTGAWDDNDDFREDEICPGIAEGPATESLTEKLEPLCNGELYVNVHTSQNAQTDAKGEIRGQIEPTKLGERICKQLGFD